MTYRNPKGRAASVTSFALWSACLALLCLNWHWNPYPFLMAALLSLLLALSGLRLYQEWKEDGDWLD